MLNGAIKKTFNSFLIYTRCRIPTEDFKASENLVKLVTN